MNKVILKGRLTNNVDIKETPNGTMVATFSIAVNRRFNKEQTDFINCQAWKNTAEFLEKYFSKGQEILAVGELHIEKWQKDEETRTTARVVVDEVYFCGSKAENKNQIDVIAQSFEEISDELPF